jgi:hypothetical protein
VREYIAVGRSLSAGEIRVLAACYNYLSEWHSLAKDGPLDAGYVHNYTIDKALNVLRQRTGLKHTALIRRLEASLVEKHLVRPDSVATGAVEVDASLYRLTDFGSAFCEFLTAYDGMKGDEGTT